MRVLDNPVYIGKITYGKSTTERVKGTRDEYHRVQVEDYMVTDGKHEAIIDEELWAAQERRKETEIYPEKMDNGRICKQINFNFPVYYDGEIG